MEKTLKAADSLGAPRVYIKMLVELEVGFHQSYLHCKSEAMAACGCTKLPLQSQGSGVHVCRC